MPSRLNIISVLCVGALAFAWGPRPHAAGAPQPEARSTKGQPAAVPSPSLASSLKLTIDDGFAFALNITNNTGKRMELAFRDGQTHEFVVLDSVGREVWRWSAGRMFTQAMQNKMLDARETLTFQERWTNPANLHGRFTAIATLNTRSVPVEQRIEFSLE